MKRKLVIVESPTKAKTIGKILGRTYVVKSSMGHVRDLPKSQFGVDIENGFEPHYITIRGKGAVVKELKDWAQKSEQVFLATDPDREGEAIAWHLKQLLNLPDGPVRVEFHEITKPVVLAAMENPREIDARLVEAQQARRVLDRIMGYSLSPLLWRKIRKGLSAGRVQSAALRLIVDREREIRAFIPEEYWTLHALLAPEEGGPSFSARLVKCKEEEPQIKNWEEMDSILQSLQGVSFVVVDIKRKERRRNPNPPFTTSTLQQEAHRRLNFTARKTMQIAQQLYEGVDLGGEEGSVGLITYMRTDSVRVSPLAQEEARKFILDRFGPEYLPEKPRQFKSPRESQGAHEAIRPTSVFREPSSLRGKLTEDQLRLYTLIWERFLASQMEAVLLEVLTVEITAGPALFRATGSTIKFPGFLKVYQEKVQEEDTKIPPLKVQQELFLISLDPKQHFTQPPPRYSDASLVKAMEELGIGRPSTYAPTIETLLERGYVVRRERNLVPTELGEIVVDLLKDHFPSIIDVEFTAHMERQLDEVEEGLRSWREVVEEFYQPFEDMLNRAEEAIEEIEIPDEVVEEKCPQCGRNLILKKGRYGKFLACPGFPECRFTKPYQESIGVQCPLCGGEVVVRRTKKGRIFYGCQNYPQCQYVSWDKPAPKDCPRCGTRLVEKASRRGTRWVCPNKECGYAERLEEPEGERRESQ
ncbi:MAG TPA: type I DNA topoisomerase [Moorella mulderi]|nr:type I DNA topoisomerase [Moorella mulderi]